MDRADPANAMIPRYPHPEIKITVTAAGSPPALSFLHRDHLASMRPRHRRRRKHAGDAAYDARTNECYDQCLALRPRHRTIHLIRRLGSTNNVSEPTDTGMPTMTRTTNPIGTDMPSIPTPANRAARGQVAKPPGWIAVRTSASECLDQLQFRGQSCCLWQCARV
jgi:hypothetical protein